MDALYTQFDGVFFEKTRLSMITVLYRESEASFTRLKKVFDLSDGSAYSHLRKLIDAGYVRARRKLTNNRAETWYSLTDTGGKTFRDYLDFLVSHAHADNPEGAKG